MDGCRGIEPRESVEKGREEFATTIEHHVARKQHENNQPKLSQALKRQTSSV